jgi:hypothetical protein
MNLCYKRPDDVLLPKGDWRLTAAAVQRPGNTSLEIPMNPSHKVRATAVAVCVCLFACGSTPEGASPSVSSEALGNIVITGVTGAQCFGKVTMTIDGLDRPVVFPGPQQMDMQEKVTVENGLVTIPVAPTAKGPVEITDVLVEIPVGCAVMDGVFEYLGSTIALKPGEHKEIAWSDFDEG